MQAERGCTTLTAHGTPRQSGSSITNRGELPDILTIKIKNKMKTKTIPFDLEMAKKIQAGEIKGRITTKDGKDVRIICTDKASTDDDNRTQIVCLVRFGAREILSINDPNTGECWDVEDGRPQNLVLEVPDIKPQFKVGDKVRVRPNDTHSHFVKQYDNCIGKIVGTNHEYFVVIVTGAFQDQFLSEELELAEETAKHEFKTFDRVLVRDDDEEEWETSYFSRVKIIRDVPYYVAGNIRWKQCIPYEGNQELLGTTDKPKEE